MYAIPALSLLSETFPFRIASNKTHQGQGIGMQTPPRDTTHAPNYIYTAKDGVEVIPINIASASRSLLKSAILLKETATGIPIMLENNRPPGHRSACRVPLHSNHEHDAH